VHVQDVVAGSGLLGQVRFVLRTADGQEGYVECDLSGTNSIWRETQQKGRPWGFSEEFYLEDPRRLYPWDEKTWEAIERRVVFVGMTPEQARLSWGEAQEVNRTTTAQQQREQWVYGLGTYLYFVDGRLDAIQN
jgi:hypothetical protein